MNYLIEESNISCADDNQREVTTLWIPQPEKPGWYWFGGKCCSNPDPIIFITNVTEETKGKLVAAPYNMEWKDSVDPKEEHFIGRWIGPIDHAPYIISNIQGDYELRMDSNILFIRANTGAVSFDYNGVRCTTTSTQFEPIYNWLAE